MSDGYIKFNDVLTAVGNMLKEMGSKEITIDTEGYDLSEFCDKLYKSAYEKGAKDAKALAELNFNEVYPCHGCVYENMLDVKYPCRYCGRYYEDMYTDTKGDSNG